jgi:hypothetical protein
MTLFSSANLFFHFLVYVVDLLSFEFINISLILLFGLIKSVGFSEVILFILFFFCFVHFSHIFLEFNSFFNNSVPFMAVHFSKIFFRVTINLVDWVLFDKLKILFENNVELIKVWSNLFLIFKHHLNNMRQFLILSFVENV